MVRLSLLLLTMACWPASRARGAPSPTAISFAEQPVSLFRERAFYIAGRGVPLPTWERQAAFADVAPWLAPDPALKQLIQRRYAPRKPAPSFSY
jgi:hypothetical protein